MEKKIIINAEGKRIGRVASEAAKILMGKQSVAYAPNKVADVKVEITNTSKAEISEKLTDEKTNQILLTFDSKKLTQQNFGIITSLAKIIKDSGELGTFEHDIFSFEIKGLDTFQDKLVNNNDEYYTKQLKEINNIK